VVGVARDEVARQVVADARAAAEVVRQQQVDAQALRLPQAKRHHRQRSQRRRLDSRPGRQRRQLQLRQRKNARIPARI